MIIKIFQVLLQCYSLQYRMNFIKLVMLICTRVTDSEGY
jgi:hypothetical protein